MCRGIGRVCYISSHNSPGKQGLCLNGTMIEREQVHFSGFFGVTLMHWWTGIPTKSELGQS